MDLVDTEASTEANGSQMTPRDEVAMWFAGVPAGEIAAHATASAAANTRLLRVD